MWVHRPRVRNLLRPLFLYTLISLALTWPLAARFTTHIPGDGIDDPALYWNLWWVKFALVERVGHNPFDADVMFHPIGINLAFYTLTVLNGLISVPLQVAWGLTPASNLILLSSFILSAYGAYLFSRLILPGRQGRDTAAFLAGLFYGFASTKLFYAALGQFNIASTQWLPFAAIYLHRLYCRGRTERSKLKVEGSRSKGRSSGSQSEIRNSKSEIRNRKANQRISESANSPFAIRHSLLLTAFLTFQAYAELTFAAFFVVWMALAALWWTAHAILANRSTPPATPLTCSGSKSRSRNPPCAMRHAPFASLRLLTANAYLLSAIILFLIALSPLLANMIPDMRAEGDFWVEGQGFADVFSADLVGYLFPTQLHPLLGGVIRTLSHDSVPQPGGREWGVNKGQHIYLGYITLILALWGFWRHRRRPEVLFLACSALFFFLLTLGPNVRLAGWPTPIPGPFRLFQHLPLLKGNRYPSRWAVMLLHTLAPLFALGIQQLLALRVENSRLKIRNPHFSIRNPQSTIRNPQPKIRNPRSAIRNPQSAIRNPQSKIQNPKSKIPPHPTTRPNPLTANRYLLTAVLVLLLLFEHLSLPLPMTATRVPSPYRALGDSGLRPAPALLELPLGWRNGFSVFGKQDVIIMFEQMWQTAHGWPILGGNTSRNPPFKFEYFLNAPLINTLVALENGHTPPEEQLAWDRAHAGEVLRALGIGAIALHPENTPPALVDYVEGVLPTRLLAEGDNTRLYAVNLTSTASEGEFWNRGRDGVPPSAPGAGQGATSPSGEVSALPAPVLLLSPDDLLSHFFLGEGWAPTGLTLLQPPAAFWAQREEVRLQVPLPGGDYTLTLAVTPAAPDTALTVVVNGHPLVPTRLQGTTLQTVTVTLPAAVVRPGWNRLRLRFSRTVSVPALVAQGALETGGFPWHLTVQSAGKEVGDFARLFVNGVDLSPNRRGYNLVALAPPVSVGDGDSRISWRAAAFDTLGDPQGANRALVAFLQSLPPGMILLGAVRDEGTVNLSAEAEAALKALGLEVPVRGAFRRSHAFILRVGDPASAREAWADTHSVTLSTGPALTAPRVAARVEHMVISASAPGLAHRLTASPKMGR